MTGRDRYLTETVKGTDKAAHRSAPRRSCTQAAGGGRQAARTGDVHPAEPRAWRVAAHGRDRGHDAPDLRRLHRAARSGRRSARSPIDKLSARNLETLYAELRRCRARCDGRPYIEHHQDDGEHDCAEAEMRCRTRASRWRRRRCGRSTRSSAARCRPPCGGTGSRSNPARVAQRPRAKAPEPDPPSPADAARLLDAAFEHGRRLGHARVARHDDRHPAR